jgi:serine protease Do
VIVAINGKPVNPDETVSFLVANLPVGSRATITVVRDGKRINIPVVVTQRPTQEQLEKQLGVDDENVLPGNGSKPAATEALGLTLQSITPQIAQALKLPPGTSGVIIADVDASSDAAQKGLQRGDVILSVNAQKVTSPAQVSAAVAAAKKAGRGSVLLLVKRGTSPEAFVGIDISGD